MRLLADTVELVMRTHHTLAQNGNNNDDNNNKNGSSNAGNGSINSAGNFSNVAGGMLSARSDSDGGSSLWSASPRDPSGRSMSSDDRSGGGSGPCRGAAATVPPSPLQPGSPPLLSDRPFGSVYDGGRHNMMSISPSGMSDEQNAPPPARFSGRKAAPAPQSYAVPMRVPLQQHPHHGQPVRHGWHVEDSRMICQHRGVGGAEDSVQGRGRSGVHAPGGEHSRSARPACRSPLGARSAQGPQNHSQHHHHQQKQHMPTLDVDQGPPPPGLLPVSIQCPSPAGLQSSDWRAVQKAFGSPSALHMPIPPPIMVPTTPPVRSPMPKLPPRSASTVANAAVAAAAAAASNMSKHEGFYPSRVDSGVGNDGGEGAIQGEGGWETEGVSPSSLSSALAQTQWQIESMLDRHSRALEKRISEMEHMLSARLTLLETRVHSGLDHNGAPVRTS